MSTTPLLRSRLFVPLNRAAYEAFGIRQKTWELRLHRRQWTRRQIVIGRRVELRCGYSSGKSLWGEVVAVRDAPTVTQMFARVGYRLFVPRAASEVEALQIAEQTLGSVHDPVIAFQIALDA